MRIKSFVTNSSSTNFIILFDGETKKDLYRILRKYSMFFDLKLKIEFESGQDDTYKTDVEQVIKAIESVIDKGIPYQEPVVIRDLNTLVKDREEEIKREEEFMRGEKAISKSFTSSLWEWVEENKGLLDEIKRAKQRGLKSVLEIQFGDNDGHISDPGIGSTMDYEGRYIDLSTPDIKIITEQRR